jgi:hypothetical protein
MMEEPKRVEETRRGVAKMAVDESGHEKTASTMLGVMAEKAKNGWEKVKKLMEGKKVVRMAGEGGKIMVVKQTDRLEEAVTSKSEWDEDIMGGTVEIEDVTGGTEESRERDDRVSIGSGTRSGGGILEFMEDVEVESRDISLDDKVDEGRKRKREDDGPPNRKKGLNGLPGWERRSKMTREDDRWKRTVVSWEEDKKGQEVRKEVREKIPVPDGFDLGK